MKTNYWVIKYKYKFFQKQLYRLKGVTQTNFITNRLFSYLLKSLKSIFLFSSQIEAGRKILRHFIKKFIKIYINLSCDKSITLKSNGVRMGKGKGNLTEWVNCLKTGGTIYNIIFINDIQSMYLLAKSMKKFNFKTIALQINIFQHSKLKYNYFY